MATIPSGLTKVIVEFSALVFKRAWPLVQVLLVGARPWRLGSARSSPCCASRACRSRANSRNITDVEPCQMVDDGGQPKPAGAANRSIRPDGPMLMALDDTIERRRGARIAAKGIYRDPMRSIHSWLCLMLVAPIPWAKR